MTQKVCAIVGAGPGLGLALARGFGALGHSIALLARRPEALAELKKPLEAEGITAAGFLCDAGRVDSIRASLAKVAEDLGPPTLLIYNASIYREGLPSEVEPEKLAEDLALDVVGAAAAVQAVLPRMRSARGGTILLTGSGVALHPWAPAYTLSVGKAALRSFALCLAEELKESEIHAATITIDGVIQPSGPFSPEHIAKAFVAVYQQAKPEWQGELRYQGD
ncbi:MAG: SDR family NAD(P)-dependent oxidoreductase [Myxococcota bacterium]